MSRAEKGLPAWFERPVAAGGLVALSPVLLLCAAAVRLSSPGPLLFRQERVGQGGKRFILFKFRTMQTGQEGAQVTRSGDVRITSVGCLLRKLKLDELPELWNIVRGEISLVGPRPEVPRYIDFANPLWAEVLRARPGITDPVTLRLRNEEELLPQGQDPERFYSEVLQPVKLRGYAEYLRRRTWRTDLVVLVETILAVMVPAIAPPPSLEDLKRQPEVLFRLSRWPVREQE